MTTASPTCARQVREVARGRGALRSSARLAVAGAVLLATVTGAATGASADENGIGSFLSSIFGGQPQQAAPQPAPSSAPHYAPRYTSRNDAAPTLYRRAPARPLTVRLRPAKHQLVFAQSPTKPGKVSIYEDKTLRRGDAVMTADGVRIFAGSTSWPYAAGDFVSLKSARSIDNDTSKVLAQLDKLPRG